MPERASLPLPPTVRPPAPLSTPESESVVSAAVVIVPELDRLTARLMVELVVEARVPPAKVSPPVPSVVSPAISKVPALSVVPPL